ncbi:MAG TPA: hypothetical protein VES02_11690 [Dermatophilaceae bacterium]|nr:hypothetical protein [Dermatophilaceae bacterium]
MSDSSQGAGWWQASDGKWYPPTMQPGTAPPPVQQAPAPPPVQQAPSPAPAPTEPVASQPPPVVGATPAPSGANPTPAGTPFMQQPYMKGAVIMLAVFAMVFVTAAVLLRTVGGDSDIRGQVAAAFDDDPATAKQECKTFMSDVSSKDDIDEVFDAFGPAEERAFLAAQRTNSLFKESDFEDLDFDDVREATYALFDECESRGYD